MSSTARRAAIVAALALPALAVSGTGSAWAQTSTITAKGGNSQFTFSHTLSPDAPVSTTCQLTYVNGYSGTVGSLPGTPDGGTPLRWTGTVTGLKGGTYTVTADCLGDDAPATTRVFVVGAIK